MSPNPRNRRFGADSGDCPPFRGESAGQQFALLRPEVVQLPACVNDAGNCLAMEIRQALEPVVVVVEIVQGGG